MNIPANYFIIIDIIVVAVFIICFILSYKNGLIYELISLLFIVISLFLGYFFSPMMAKRFYLIKPSLQDNPLINSDIIYYSINTVIWFIIISIFFIILFIFVKPLFKKLTKVPIIGWIDKLFGFIFGFIKGFIICVLLSCLLSTSLIKNSNEVKEKTLIKYVDFYSDSAIRFLVKNIDYKMINDNLSEIDIQTIRDEFEKWLIKQGFLNE